MGLSSLAEAAKAVHSTLTLTVSILQETWESGLPLPTWESAAEGSQEEDGHPSERGLVQLFRAQPLAQLSGPLQ